MRRTIAAAGAVAAAGVGAVGILAISGLTGASGAGDSSTVTVTIDAATPGAAISPLIRGISGDRSAEEMNDMGVTLDSWGGNPSSRYNFISGHFWNAAADWEYRNVNYTGQEIDAFRAFAANDADAGVATRLAVPTLGWIAKDGDNAHCSFPNDAGGCDGRTADCLNPGPISDPALTSIESTPEMVAEWVRGLVDDGVDVEFISMDNEPDIWGVTHYDVHPECATYEEILDKYISYAQAIRVVAPDAQLLGPVMCCWYDYWNTAPGPADGSDQEFLPWFLDQVRAADEAFGQRTLDVVDVHFYPQGDVFNDWLDPDTSARRIRSVRALWDPDYVDESWIGAPIAFVPRILEIIDEHYPDTPLAITEWNFGAEEAMNGAIAIADVLGVYGREGVYAAAYWRSPDVNSPGYFAFKMHGNYDDAGTAFEGAVVPVSTSDVDTMDVFAAVDADDGVLRLMFVNKRPDHAVAVDLVVNGFTVSGEARRFTYGPSNLGGIVADTMTLGSQLEVPAESIVVIEVPGR
jgi:hypothetical protein